MSHRRNEHPLILIQWIDSSASQHGWEKLEDVEHHTPVLIASCGWVVREDDEVVTLAQNVGGLKGEGIPQVCNLMTVPKVCIRTRKTLRG